MSTDLPSPFMQHIYSQTKPCALTVQSLRAILRPMRVLSVIVLLTALILPTVAIAEVQNFTATHTYILGDRDSKEDARQRCLLETKRKILEQAGVYIESASEVKNFDLTKDKITSFAATVMQVKDTKEEVSFQQGHMSLMLTMVAQVDLEEMRKQLAARRVDAAMQDTVTAQQERLKRLEVQLETMQRQQGGQSSGHAPASSPIDIAPDDIESLQTKAAQGDAEAQVKLGMLYHFGQGVPQDYAKARQWYEQAAAQGHAFAQTLLGGLYWYGLGVPRDVAKARQWYEKAAAQGDKWAKTRLGELYAIGSGVPQDYAMARQLWEQAAAQGDAGAQNRLGLMYKEGQGVPQDYLQAVKWFEQAAAQDYHAQYNLGELYYDGKGVPKDYVRAYMWYSFAAAHSIDPDLDKFRVGRRDKVARRMTPAQIAEAQRLASQCQAQQFKGC